MKLENGKYIKGEIRGVSHRTFTDKKTGEVMHFYSVVMEETFDRDKVELQLPRAAVNKGLVEQISKMNGKVVLAPFYISFRNNYLNYHYSGEELPIVLDAPKPAAQGAA